MDIDKLEPVASYPVLPKHRIVIDLDEFVDQFVEHQCMLADAATTVMDIDFDPVPAPPASMPAPLMLEETSTTAWAHGGKREYQVAPDPVMWPAVCSSTTEKFQAQVRDIEGEDTEYIEVSSEGNTDLTALLRYFDSMQQGNFRVTEATFIINTWYYGGFIPLSHHGFIFTLSDQEGPAEYLSLDFGRLGIVWDVFDDYPALPDETTHLERLMLDVDMEPLKIYCTETKPFNFFTNDCSIWSAGLLERLKQVGKTDEVVWHKVGKPREAPLPPSSRGKDRVQGWFSVLCN